MFSITNAEPNFPSDFTDDKSCATLDAVSFTNVFAYQDDELNGDTDTIRSGSSLDSSEERKGDSTSGNVMKKPKSVFDQLTGLLLYVFRMLVGRDTFCSIGGRLLKERDGGSTLQSLEIQTAGL